MRPSASRNHERGKMTTLLKTWPKVFLLFLLFVRFEDLHGVLGALRLAIGVHDTDVDDAIRSAGPEAANQ
jgi:hypothetical protein